ncbi:MAG TPA: prepilin-type N-terminal cleavage/methylation domain-containing protein [Nitratidesulfovibrio sp.]|nr:prepilin-type N-terminal cleavage/methylation domain-containing protein [Nitratidesulfovibrio sp.]
MNKSATHSTSACIPAAVRHRDGAVFRCALGFTLLEIIITIVIIAVIAAMMLPLTGTALRGSAESLIATENEVRLLRVVETMNADYRRTFMDPTGNGNPLATFFTAVGDVGTHTSPTYGTYTLVEKRYIQFDANHGEVTGGTNLLKLTLELDNTRVTCLFGQ